MRFFIGVLCTFAVITLFKALHVALFGRLDDDSWYSGFVTGAAALFIVGVVDTKLRK